MVRATFGKEQVFIVGQYTHAGTVTAADSWGGPHRAMALKAASEESYEGQLHQMQQSEGGDLIGPDPFYFATRPFAPRGAAAGGEGKAGAAGAAGAGGGEKEDEEGEGKKGGDSSSSSSSTSSIGGGGGGMLSSVLAEHPITVALAKILQDRETRLQRWVGVMYKPLTEKQSHYGEMSLCACYDLIVFVDETNALTPIGAGGGGKAGNGGGAAGDGGGGAGGRVSNQSSNKRLLKEYRRLLRQPPPNIAAHPLECNMLEWHFVLTPDQGPYAGGEYHGLLEFPWEYVKEREREKR